MVQQNCMTLWLRLRQEIGRREILTSLFMRSVRNLNLNDSRYIKEVDGQIWIREVKINLCRECEFRNLLFQEDHARDFKEIEELRRICCEEVDQARQARIEELSMQQERNPMTVSQLMALIQFWSNPRSQSNLFYSEFQNLAAL